MAINFPASPTVNDVYTYGDKRWVWDGQSWVCDNLNLLYYNLGKNYIINGNFRFWQRGTSQSSTVNSYGSDDRWINEFNGITRHHGIGTFPLGQTEVDGNPIYYSSTNVQSLGTLPSHYCIKRHRVDRVYYSSSKTMTLSFWARTSVIGNQLAVSGQQTTGAGGSLANNIPITKVTLGGTWTKFTSTFIWPSIAGGTLGSNHYFGIDFWFSAGSSFSDRTDSLGFQTGIFEIAQVQLEDGTVATDFENIGEDLMFLKCLRYYQQTAPYASDPYTGALGLIYIKNYYTSSSAAYYTHQYIIPMRTAPTVTLWNPATGTSGTWRMSSGTDGVISVGQIIDKSLVFFPTLAGLTTAYGHITLDAEL